ncbi:NTP transferase domain-containing protein [Actinocrispum sp. NPDC049592]|uniref:molybdenum cofactor guanylyltransferase n=1 Tax=Actinocrispum sp. NPDC049592 TaxID=3154835 RepID=UPI0034497C50
MRFAAIIFAGGKATRLGGVDKVMLRVNGQTLLERSLDAVTGADPIVVVGPRRDIQAPVVWVREDPPGAGPLAALAAGLAALDKPHIAIDDPGEVHVAVDDSGHTDVVVDDPGDTDVAVDAPGDAHVAVGDPGDIQVAVDDPGEVHLVVDDAGDTQVAVEDPGDTHVAIDHSGDTHVAILAGDLIGIATDTVPRLRSTLDANPGAAGAILVDDEGYLQWMHGVWRLSALRQAVPPGAAGKSLKSVLGALPLIEVPARAGETADVDTPEDLA